MWLEASDCLMVIMVISLARGVDGKQSSWNGTALRADQARSWFIPGSNDPEEALTIRRRYVTL